MDMSGVTFLRCDHSNPDKKTVLCRTAKNLLAEAIVECDKCYRPKQECKDFLELFRAFISAYDDLIKAP
jgi:hypothetical protein